jgi:hypothetical protein
MLGKVHNLQLLQSMFPKSPEIDKMYPTLVQIMEREGFIAAVDFVLHDGNMYISNRVAAHFNSLNIPGVEELGGGTEDVCHIALARPFIHPLSQVYEGPTEPILNGWACASMLINSAAMWGDGDDLPQDQGKTARQNLKQWIVMEQPLWDVDAMLDRARWDDNILMQLVTTAAGGFEKIADGVPNKRRF